jgi:AICAR transformylase/IMP cyclohydrolase PurH
VVIVIKEQLIKWINKSKFFVYPQESQAGALEVISVEGLYKALEELGISVTEVKSFNV